MKPTVKYCAVYTRKSTEEGLDQEFNTLDAQREGCLAFITSQKAEGWVALPDNYDDGGYSGGNLNRPALHQLITDIKAGKINIVVVYKIDRLTRSLMDFSKLVEIFDQYGVTFISITQSFNTTTSMGRLTLNVLLSFAQFEREVIGERVRDKIAASKKKGMWMGGNNPVGYHRVNKELVPKEDEISFVKYLFERYLQLGSVAKLILEMRSKNIKSRVWISSNGKTYGNNTYSSGALYSILSNPVYIGKIKHRDKVYDGLHPAIIDRKLWDAVQEKLKNNTVERRVQQPQQQLLTSIIYDVNGVRYSPSHTNKRGRRYRYYISQNLLKAREYPANLMGRLPAEEIEDVVRTALRQQLSTYDSTAHLLGLDPIKDSKTIESVHAQRDSIDVDAVIRHACLRVEVGIDSAAITFSSARLAKYLVETLQVTLPDIAADLTPIFTVPLYITRRYRGTITIIAGDEKLAKDDPFNRAPHEIQNWVKGIAWRDQYFRGRKLDVIAEKENVDVRYVARMIDQTFEIR